jgi:phosphoglycerol transferase MdoB-like AlkP superfamily enzyme
MLSHIKERELTQAFWIIAPAYYFLFFILAHVTDIFLEGMGVFFNIRFGIRVIFIFLSGLIPALIVWKNSKNTEHSIFTLLARFAVIVELLLVGFMLYSSFTTQYLT